jgi:hypothetical protein
MRVVWLPNCKSGLLWPKMLHASGCHRRPCFFRSVYGPVCGAVSEMRRLGLHNAKSPDAAAV